MIYIDYSSDINLVTVGYSSDIKLVIVDYSDGVEQKRAQGFQLGHVQKGDPYLLEL